MSKINARQEFTIEITGKTVIAAVIHHEEAYIIKCTAILFPRYTSDEYETFFNSLNFDYDSGYGGQELFGVIWYADSTWSERYEYDGKECWIHREYPNVVEIINYYKNIEGKTK